MNSVPSTGEASTQAADRRLRIGLVHALHASIEPVETAFAELWPEAQTLSLYDQSLYAEFDRAGDLTPFLSNRVAALLRLSAESGVNGILFTGSLFGAAVAASRTTMAIPVLTAYEAMIEEAFSVVERPRLGVLTTVASTATRMREDIDAYARRHARKYRLEIRYVAGAFDALLGHERARHDAMIVEAAQTLGECDALMLAQFSMAAVAPHLRARGGTRVLESPRSAVRKLRSLIEG